jgi:hypothetical protein
VGRAGVGLASTPKAAFRERDRGTAEDSKFFVAALLGMTNPIGVVPEMTGAVAAFFGMTFLQPILTL